MILTGEIVRPRGLTGNIKQQSPLVGTIVPNTSVLSSGLKMNESILTITIKDETTTGYFPVGW